MATVRKTGPVNSIKPGPTRVDGEQRYSLKTASADER
jgi:hypothetical protein